MNDNVTSIFHNFPVRDMEYQELEKKFGKLCHFANWELKRKNTKNHTTDEHDDIAQELRIKLITAGAYYKRQVYIEASLRTSVEYAIQGLELNASQAARLLVDNNWDWDEAIALGEVHPEEANTMKEEIRSDPRGFMFLVIGELYNLWLNRTRHGANRVKFGEFQEKLLDRIVKKIVPKDKRPNRRADLKIDAKFTTYCKAIVWNGQKTMGKKITKEKGIRTGMVSLNDYDYLVGC